MSAPKDPKRREEWIEKLSASAKIAMNRPDVKVKLRASLKRFYQEHPEHQKEIQNRPDVKAKNRASQLGKPKSEEHKIKHRGESNSNWRGGIGNLPYPFEFNREFKELIRERYDHTCVLCKLTQEQVDHILRVHHIDYDKDNPDPDNFVPLCLSCHGVTSAGNRAYWTKVLQNVVEMNKKSCRKVYSRV